MSSIWTENTFYIYNGPFPKSKKKRIRNKWQKKYKRHIGDFTLSKMFYNVTGDKVQVEVTFK